jgi:tetratricopeptide (TPR) repeat protein
MSRNAAVAAVVEPETEAALQAAYGALGTGDLDAAERAFRHVLDTTHARAKALNGLGIVAAMRGQSGLAVGLYRQAIESAPDYALPRDNLIRLLAAETGRRADAGAEATLDAARELLDDGVADLGEARAILGQAYARLGRQYRQTSGDANRVAAIRPAPCCPTTRTCASPSMSRCMHRVCRRRSPTTPPTSRPRRSAGAW